MHGSSRSHNENKRIFTWVGELIWRIEPPKMYRLWVFYSNFDIKKARQKTISFGEVYSPCQPDIYIIDIKFLEVRYFDIPLYLNF